MFHGYQASDRDADEMAGQLSYSVCRRLGYHPGYMESKQSVDERFCVAEMKQEKHVGSSLDDFLAEEGILEESRAIAIKEAVAKAAAMAKPTAGSSLRSE